MLKQKANLFILFFVLTITSSCARKYLSLFRAELEQKNFKKEVVKSDPTYGFTIIPIVISGKTFRFIFDTGAQITLITSETAQKIKISDAGSIKVNDSQGVSSKLYFGVIDSLKIGQLNFSKVGTAIIKNGISNYFKCLDVDGVLGMNVMRLCNWKLDYDKNSISIQSYDSLFTNKNAIKIPFEIHKGVPKSYWYVNGNRLFFTMDTGKNGVEIGVPSGHYYSKPIRKIIGYSSFGLHGKTTLDTTSTIVCSLSDSLDFNLKNIAFEQSTNNQTLVGNRFFKMYYSSLAFNFKDNTMRAIERENPDERIVVYPFTPMQKGQYLCIATTVLNEKRFQVGDTIVAINKVAQNNHTNCDLIRQYMKSLENKENIDIKIKHKGEILHFNFQAQAIQKP